jgi:hypothetical protein
VPRRIFPVIKDKSVVILHVDPSNLALGVALPRRHWRQRQPRFGRVAALLLVRFVQELLTLPKREHSLTLLNRNECTQALPRLALEASETAMRKG